MRSGHIGRRAFLTLFALGLCAFIVLLGSVRVGGGPRVTSSLAAPSTPSALGATPTAVPPALPVAKPTKTANERHPKLASPLAKLSDAVTQPRAPGDIIVPSTPAGLPDDVTNLVQTGLMQIDSENRVQVYIEVAQADFAVIDALVAAGVAIQRVATDSLTVQGLVPATSLDAVAGLEAVREVRLPDYPFVQSSPVTMEGDAVVKADVARLVFGVTGEGVRVGVISDGLYGLADAQAKGALPLDIDIQTCNAVTHGEPGWLFGDPTHGGAEGTAMLEVVHAIAPDAELWFGYYGYPGTVMDFNAAVDCLAANTDVVVDDVSGFNVGPYDGTSDISSNTSAGLNGTANRVRVYSTSAGNYAIQHYRGQFADYGGSYPGWHTFQATSDTSDTLNLGPSPFDRLWLAQGSKVILFLQWDDPWGASSDDYDLRLYREGADGQPEVTPVVSSENSQDGDDNPTEQLGYVNSGASGYFDIAVVKRSGGSRTLHMFVIPTQPLPGTGVYHNFNTVWHSVPNQGDAGGGVISVGAISASDPGNDTIEAFSSQGPTNDYRTKPDVTGLDRVCIAGSGGFGFSSCPGGGRQFLGTSAAAPHVAGVAALLLECRPDLEAGESEDDPSADRTALRDLILNNAVDLGTSGTDNTFGAGRLDAYASALAAGGNCIMSDPDEDGVPDPLDNCPFDYNPDQLNTDALPTDNGPDVLGDDASVPNSDSLGDVCDPDDDNDWMLDTDAGLSSTVPGEDLGCGSGPTNAKLVDSDGDTVVDGYECLVSIDPNDALSRRPPSSADSDRDGLSDSLEALFNSDAHRSDTDGDGISDGVEVRGWGSSPTAQDTNGDGCSDNIEMADVNGDYRVNIFDVLFVAKAAGHVIGTNADLDLDKDGGINVLDVLTVAHQLSKTCTPP